MAVDRGARDLKQIGNALNGVVPGVVELLGVVGLVRGEFGASSSGSSADPGGREAVAGVGDDEFSLEFGEGEFGVSRETIYQYLKTGR
ncbi:hypothetical protein V3C33_05235 [Micrococcaceae bacterium Sec5.7]